MSAPQRPPSNFVGGLRQGCTPLSASVLLGVAGGYLALSSTCTGLSPRCLLILLAGYAIGAIIGHIAVSLVGRAVGPWWDA